MAGEQGQPKPGDTFAGFLTGNAQADQKNLDILLATIAEVNSTIDLDDLLMSVVDKTLVFTKAERGILMLFDAKGELRIRVARDQHGRDLPPDVNYSRTIPHKVVSEGVPVTLIDAASQSEATLGQSIMDLRLLTVMCVPLKTKDRTIGALYVDSRAAAGEYNEGHLTLFKALSYQLAIAIENTRLLSEALEKERLEHSLAMAREIQQSLLPPGRILREGIDVFGISIPCDETGGDYFDYITFREGHLGLVVGDVSGHGVDAALFMATARAFLRAFASTGEDLSCVIGDLNNALERDMGTGSFMTLFYCDVDVRERTLRYVRAGHNPPFLLRKGAGEFEELDQGGMGLGFERNHEFKVAGPVELEVGDILVLFTDGIPEARNSQKELFDEERLRNIVREHQESSAKEIVEEIVDQVNRFTGGVGVEDDVTLIVAKAVENGAG
jgi:sigma-B regulation protein RsbU (phosphoserine phosphatase)